MRPLLSVLLCDDHALVRDMLHDRLSREGMEIVGVAPSGETAIEIAGDQRPDVAILDIDMPGISPFEAARAVKRVSPDTRVVFLSAFVNDTYIDQALAAEASGYLTKSEPPDSIIRAIRRVHQGATSFSLEVLERLVVDSSGVRLNGSRRSRFDALTGREREILGYVARGLSQKQIARLAGISVKTVQHHVTHLMDKLEIHDRVELTRFAIREGLVEA
jgi:DNA-binding NarL/FixJ family response regulator